MTKRPVIFFRLIFAVIHIDLEAHLPFLCTKPRVPSKKVCTFTVHLLTSLSSLFFSSDESTWFPFFLQRFHHFQRDIFRILSSIQQNCQVISSDIKTCAN